MNKPNWKRAEIVCAVKMNGTNLSALARAHNLDSGTLYNSLTKKCPKHDKIIADCIGVDVSEIWLCFCRCHKIGIQSCSD